VTSESIRSASPIRIYSSFSLVDDNIRLVSNSSIPRFDSFDCDFDFGSSPLHSLTAGTLLD